MIQLVGYNFLSDGDVLNPYPAQVDNIVSATVQDGEFNGFYITRDVTSAYSTQMPSEWDIYTILLADFDGNLSGGSIDQTIDQIDTIRIKRRKVGEFDWTTIYEQTVTSPSDLTFGGEDNFVAYGTEYEYAWVPVLAGIEGNYVTSTIESKFNGVFICDADTVYKFYAGVEYGPSQQVQQVGVYNPLGQKYPVYVTNGATNYQTGSVTGKITGNYENTGVFDRQEMVEQKNNLIAWLTNKKAKILKDWNGNIWLVFITGQPSVTYDAQWGNGMMEIRFEYGEIGDAESVSDMQNVGLLPTITT